MDAAAVLHGKGKPLSSSYAKLYCSRQSTGHRFLAMEMNYLKKPVLLGGIKAIAQVMSGNIKMRLACTLPCRTQASCGRMGPWNGTWNAHPAAAHCGIPAQGGGYWCSWVPLDTTVWAQAQDWSKGSRFLVASLAVWWDILERRLELVYNWSATFFSHLYFPI